MTLVVIPPRAEPPRDYPKFQEMRVTDDMVQAVKADLAKGHARSAVAARHGVSKSTVGRISLGKYVRKRDRPRVWDWDAPFDKSRVVLCRNCGVNVHPPCMVCKLAGRKPKVAPERKLLAPEQEHPKAKTRLMPEWFENTRLTFIEEVCTVNPRGGREVIRYRCRCICGKETLVAPYDLKHGRAKSCGCYARTKFRSPEELSA